MDGGYQPFVTSPSPSNQEQRSPSLEHVLRKVDLQIVNLSQKALMFNPPFGVACESAEVSIYPNMAIRFLRQVSDGPLRHF